MIYNDLSTLVKEELNDERIAKSLTDCKIKLDKLSEVLRDRKHNIIKVRIASCHEISDETSEFISKLESHGIKAEEIKWDNK